MTVTVKAFFRARSVVEQLQVLSETDPEAKELFDHVYFDDRGSIGLELTVFTKDGIPCISQARFLPTVPLGG